MLRPALPFFHGAAARYEYRTRHSCDRAWRPAHGMSTASAIPTRTHSGTRHRGARRRRRLALLRQHRWIYFLMLPALLFFVLFRYVADGTA